MVGFAIARVLRELLCHRGDPDSSESHSLDIVQLAKISVINATTERGAYVIDYSLPCPSTVCLDESGSQGHQFAREKHTLSLTLHVAVVELSLRPNRSVNMK
jgi:hypothetical protein